MAISEQLNMAASGAAIIFMDLFDTAVVSYSPLLVEGGHAASLDCFKTKNRIISIVLDSHPGVFNISVTDANDQVISNDVLPEAQITTSTLLGYMENHFHK